MARLPNIKVETVSVRDQVYRQLMDLILDGTYPAGMRLDLNELAESMGVSKTPVNEALQGLVREGLVNVKPRSGTFVSKIDIPTAVDNFGFRLAMEIGAAEMILENVTPEKIAELERFNHAMESRISGGPSKRSLKQAVREDFNFHRALIAASGNKVMTEKYCRANALLVVMRLQERYDLDEYKQAIGEHNLIIGSLREGDLEKFRSACKAHITCGINRITRHGSQIKENAPDDAGALHDG